MDRELGDGKFNSPIDIAWSIGIRERLAPIGMGLYACVTNITPDQAQKILGEHHIANNRNKKPGALRRYRDDMRNGMWRLTHQAIAFNSVGQLYDGQNRLQASVDSGEPFQTVVMFGVPSESMASVDCGAVRGLADAAKILGRVCSDRDAALSRGLASNGFAYRVVPSREQGLLLLDLFEEPMTQVNLWLPSRIPGFTTATVKTALGLAWYHEDRDRLGELATILNTNVVSDPLRDAAAGKLINWLIRNPNHSSGETVMRSAFRSICTAIRKFVAGESDVRRLQAGREYDYELPAAVQGQVDRIMCRPSLRA